MKQEIVKNHKVPSCPYCSEMLIYWDTTYFCDGCGVYFQVSFKEKGYGYKEIGRFGER